LNGLKVIGASRMRQLIIDILDYSRLGNGVIFRLTPVNLNMLVQEIIQTRVNNAEDKDAEISVDLLPVIEADKTSMNQLFSNLITNTNKYQRPGNKPVIKVMAEDAKDYWKFSVAIMELVLIPKISINFLRYFNTCLPGKIILVQA